jgi:CRP/FNR family transcriptional regulator, cyclic AMP receptor protein
MYDTPLRMDIASRLGALEPFAHFSPEQLAAFAACVERRRYPASERVVREGDVASDVYVIDSGRVRIQRHTPYGQYTLAVLGAGEIFGETGFVDRGARSGDAVTEVPSALLVVDPAGLGAAAERDPRLNLAVYWAFWKSLSQKLRRTNEMLSRFFSQSGGPQQTPPPASKEITGEFRIDLAAKRSLFQEQKLSAMEINFLSTLSHERKLRPGQLLFREGEPGDAMYVVLEGQVMISKFIPGAGEEALAFLERGDYFGEMALIDNQPRSADAKAHEGGAVVLTLPREVVAGLLDIHKVSSLRLLKILCGLVAKRLREVDDKIIGWHILAAGGGAQEPSAAEPA